jgi:hypothetical protein
MTVRDGTLYWSAIDGDGVNAGVYGRTPGQPAFTVAPLALPGNSAGLRTTPLPQLYVDENGIWRLRPTAGAKGWDAGQIVRGEAGRRVHPLHQLCRHHAARARHGAPQQQQALGHDRHRDRAGDPDRHRSGRGHHLARAGHGQRRHGHAMISPLRNDAALAAADTF